MCHIIIEEKRKIVYEFFWKILKIKITSEKNKNAPANSKYCVQDKYKSNIIVAGKWYTWLEKRLRSTEIIALKRGMDIGRSMLISKPILPQMFTIGEKNPHI